MGGKAPHPRPSGVRADPHESLNPFLDSNSYTAHKLHHATHSHLHLTTRGIFVGPVPEAWLKTHRHEWYKDHLHINYSRKHASFSWQTSRAGEGSPAAPQSPRVGNENGYRVGERFAHREREDDLIDMAEELVPSSAPVPIPGTMPLSDSEGEGNDDAFYTSPPSPRGRSKGPPPSSAAKPEPTTPGAESWQTASESFGSRNSSKPPEQGGRAQLGEETQEVLQINGSSSNTAPDISFSKRSKRNVSISDNEGSAASRSFEASNSLASLLSRHDTSRSKGESSTRRSLSMLKGGSLLTRGKPKQQDVEPGPRVATNNDRVAGGMVRFNTAVLVHERDKQMQLKLAELSRRRSLRCGGRFPRRHRDGEIIKMENMLVRVDCVKGQLPNDYDENESVKFDTKTIERWREFIVVCREGSTDTTGEEKPMTVQLYKSRTVPAIDRTHVSSRSTLTIPLVRKATRVNLYSSLDKTLVIWHTQESYTFIYLFRPRCSSSSVEWYTFLRGALGWKRPQSLQVLVPDLSVTLNIDSPFAKMEQTLATDDANDGDIIHEERAIAGDLIRKSMKQLQKCNEWDNILKQWSERERMGLAWRKYDRLEWIHGANEQRMYGTIAMQRTHQLELRPKFHYPTETTIPGLGKMIEPLPVEGFLIRLSRGKGQKREYKNLYFAKKYYWAVHDHLLFFCKPTKALPPPPPTLELGEGVVPATSQIINKIPKIYTVAPYALNAKKEIAWLQTGNKKSIDAKDIMAYQEAERKVNTVLRAEGFIDLVKVETVQLVKKLPDDINVQTSQSDTAPSAVDGTGEESIYHDKLFQMILRNGLTIKLQAHDTQTRDEWVRRLGELILYWKARSVNDMAIVRQTRNENIKELHIDEEMEALIGQYARKWEVAHASTSPILYHVCGFSSCRTITFSGPLYRKPRKHSTFARYHVVLCHGELIMFQDAVRQTTGKVIQHIHQERHTSISLQDCFIYSGIVTKDDLIHHNQTYDTNGPVRHALPRIYEDGLTSQDEESMLCFVLWHGKRRGYRTARDQQGNTVHTFGTRLGIPGSGGRAIVFKAPSRIHRDVWVMNISMEIERLHTKAFEEINIKP